MTVTIKKNSGKKDIEKALEQVGQSKKQLSEFYGKLKNVYGDGLTYQKKVRNEWD